MTKVESTEVTSIIDWVCRDAIKRYLLGELNPLVTTTMTIQEFDKPNRNGRVYSSSLMFIDEVVGKQ